MKNPTEKDYADLTIAEKAALYDGVLECSRSPVQTLKDRHEVVANLLHNLVRDYVHLAAKEYTKYLYANSSISCGDSEEAIAQAIQDALSVGDFDSYYEKLFESVRINVNLPLEKTCPECNGAGEVLGLDMFHKCRVCNGTGTVPA